MTESLVEELRSGVLFGRLSDMQLARTARNAVRVRMDEGESLFEQGDPADRFYLVTGGHIKLYRLARSGNEKIIEVVGPGGTFAEALMFLDQPRYPVGALALTPATVISIDAADFAAMLRESVETCFLLLGDLSQRLHGLLNEINDLTLYSGTRRVAAYLIQQAPAGNDALELTLPKQVLASRLSIKPETLSRILRSLGDRDVIAVRGSRIEILDRAILEQIAAVDADSRRTLLSTFFYPSSETSRH